MPSMDDETARILADDSGLDEALMQQQRPSKPPTLPEIRKEIEKLMLPGLMEGGLSAPEARVEATRVLSWLETAAFERGRERGLQQAAEG